MNDEDLSYLMLRYRISLQKDADYCIISSHDIPFSFFRQYKYIFRDHITLYVQWSYTASTVFSSYKDFFRDLLNYTNEQRETAIPNSEV